MAKMTEAERMRKCTMKNKDYITSSGKCLKKCNVPLEVRDNTTLKCVKVLSQTICDNQTPKKDYNTKTRRCVKKCTDKQTRDKNTFKCVSNKKRVPRARVATPRVATPVSANIISSISANDLNKTPDINSLILSASPQHIPQNNNSLSPRSIADLKNICKNTNYCITFGVNVDKINQYFRHYLDLNHIEVISPLNEGVNGFLLQVNYNRDNYRVSTVLKTSKKKTSTNLGYEYLVGRFINTYNKIFPSFIETHQIFKYTSVANRILVKKTYNKPSANPQTLKDSLVAIQDLNVNNVGMTCNSADTLCILIQYVDKATVLHSLLSNTSFFRFELINVLYQVYAALNIMSDVFTHYDLHTDNVILLKPYDDLYIQYIYHYSNGKTVRFNSQYIAKIIDYGYSSFNDTSPSGTNSADILKEICGEPSCGKGKHKCGTNYGYDHLSGGFASVYVTPAKINKSADLRLLQTIYLMYKASLPKISKLAGMTDFASLLTDVRYKSNYGTPEDLTNDGKIRNVMQAKDRLEKIITTFDVRKVNELMEISMVKAGTLHIYTDGSAPMKYVPYNP